MPSSIDVMNMADVILKRQIKKKVINNCNV